jgi:EAL domain-containing protein (putative c-di-GMP-specific phosphodiesterase class I)
VAEDTGLIHRLGDLILDIACHQIVVWNQQGIEGLTVAVNISPVQLKQSGFAARLRRIVEQNGALPHQIELEITEGTLMDNAELMENLLALLSVQGFQIAVDDFGTGYSSLSYLRRLSIDRIKIDKSFVKDIPHDSNDSAICSAIISMAHNLNLKVIAEGVETKEQMEYLRRERCDEIQGYIFSKPVTPEEVSEMVRQGFWHVQGRS